MCRSVKPKREKKSMDKKSMEKKLALKAKTKKTPLKQGLIYTQDKIIPNINRLANFCNVFPYYQNKALLPKQRKRR